MKLIFLLAIAFIGATTAQNNQCCPCEDDSDLLDYIVTIPNEISQSNSHQIIYQLINLLINAKIIDASTVSSILITFRIPIPSNFPNGNTLTSVAIYSLACGGKSDARIKFIQTLSVLCDRPSATGLIKALIELILSNKVASITQIVKININYGCAPQIQIVVPPGKQPAPNPNPVPPVNPYPNPAPNPNPNPNPNPQPSQPTFSADLLKPGTPLDCTVTLTQYYDNNLAIYVNRLLYILWNKQIIDIQLANRILATFGVASTSDYQFNSNGAQILLEREIMTLVIRGNPNPKTKFLKALLIYIQNPRPQVQALPLIKMLLELIIDNGIIDVASGLQMSVAYGFGIKISSLPDRPDVTYSISDIVAGEIGESTFTVTSIEEKDVYAAVNGLLEILVAKNIFDIQTANSILATFKIAGRGQFNAVAYALTAQSVSSIRINAHDQCRQRFITLLTSVINAPSNTKLVSALLTLLMDNGAINMQTAYNIMMVFRIGGQIQFQPKTKVIEPTLTGGQDYPNYFIDSTVTINQVVQDVKPLIKRLSELIVNAPFNNQPLWQQSVASSILTTFNIQTGGATITANNVGQFNFGGKVTANKKFVKNLTPLLYNPSASSNLNVLVKIMTEFLLDNAIIEYNSAVKFLVAYGVGNNINVQYQPIK